MRQDATQDARALVSCRMAKKLGLARARGRITKFGKIYQNIYEINTIYVKRLPERSQNYPIPSLGAAPKGYDAKFGFF